MQNETVNQTHSDFDFMKFIQSNFMNQIVDKIFPESYKERRAPKEFLDNITDKSEAKNISDRELIRDNIYVKFKFDIFENPIVVFYEDRNGKKLKPFKKYDEANKFAQSLLPNDIFSIFIEIMNYNIECKIFKN